MNERIKELAKQAYESSFMDPYVPNYTTDRLNQQFAELIVAECAKIVDIWSNEVPCSEGYDKFTVCKLKEHFGIKE